VHPAGAIRDDALSTLTPADGDHVNIRVDALGALWVAGSQVEDAAHASGDRGVMALAVRRDAPAVGSGTDGDYSPVNVDANGGLWVTPLVNGTATLFSSSARTATESSADQTNYTFRGGHIIINVTSITSSPSVVPKIEGKDPVSGNYYTILEGVAIVATGMTVLKVYPGAAAAVNAIAADVLPRTWRLTMTHADADSITYSAGFVGVA
jgi:hypothetical protein